jgi:hypothetical protein
VPNDLIQTVDGPCFDPPTEKDISVGAGILFPGFAGQVIDGDPHHRRLIHQLVNVGISGNDVFRRIFGHQGAQRVFFNTWSSMTSALPVTTTLS